MLEVKAIGGFGTTIDVVLVNGSLKFGQTIVLTGTEVSRVGGFIQCLLLRRWGINLLFWQGPIVTTVKALLTPSKMQDLRV